jgi:SET family sugar efflux transporter-like MFS transporter
MRIAAIAGLLFYIGMLTVHTPGLLLALQCQRKAEVSPSVRNRDVMLWFRECV